MKLYIYRNGSAVLLDDNAPLSVSENGENPVTILLNPSQSQIDLYMKRGVVTQEKT